MNKFLKKLMEAFLGKGSYLIFSFIFSLVFTRIYGAEIFGEYTYAFTILSLLVILSTAGLDKGLIYSIPIDNKKYVSISFIITSLISIFIIFISLVFVENSTLKLMLPLVGILAFEQLFFSLYRVEGKIKEYYFINGFVSIIIRIVLIIVFSHLIGVSIYSVIIAVYISYIISLFLYTITERKQFAEIRFNLNHLKYSFSLVFTAITASLINKTDIIMLGVITSNTEVGVYQIIVQISNILALLLVIFNTVFAPEISKLFHSKKTLELTTLYIKATRILTLIALLLILIIVIFSNFILQIFGDTFTQGQEALIIRSLGQFFNIAVGGVWLMLSMTGAPKFQMYANVLAILVNFLLNLLLIPKYGITGAAIASAVTIALTNLIGYVVVAKRFKLKVFKFF